jgi:hypothetical protein
MPSAIQDHGSKMQAKAKVTGGNLIDTHPCSTAILSQIQDQLLRIGSNTRALAHREGSRQFALLAKIPAIAEG